MYVTLCIPQLPVLHQGTLDTSNSVDNVFADSLASDLATVSGNITDGYEPKHIITVVA